MSERQYDGHNGESYFWDRCVATLPHHPERDAATERLKRHAEEVERALQLDRDGYEGRALRSATREQRQVTQSGETRAMTTGGGSGGSLVTPIYLVDQYAVFRAPYRAFANACRQVELPDYGMTVNIPSFTSGASVAAQTENTAVTETDPTGGYVTGGVNVTTEAGQITASLQVIERTDSKINFDQAAFAQLAEHLNAAVDLYVLNLVIANAAAPITDATFSIANFYADIAKGREGLTDTAGTRIPASHVFSTSDLFGFISHQLDSSNRPLIVPDSGALVATKDDPQWRTWTGVHLPGTMVWYADDNIPASGANTRIIVSRPDLVALAESAPFTVAYTQTNQTAGAQSLSVVLSMREYVAAVTRYPNAHSVITGAAYPTSAV